jgi:acetyl-CoA carboxylase biotin carboxyl carrier protein
MLPKFDLDSDFVRKLAKLLEETGLSEIEYAEGDRKIRCANHRSPPAAPVIQTLSAQAPHAATTLHTKSEATAVATGTPVPSPMVGTVYLASSPGASPFVKVGDKVKQGDTLLIIEAMKVMNPIKAPKAGTITEILVGDTKPVEFGEVLLIID